MSPSCVVYWRLSSCSCGTIYVREGSTRMPSLFHESIYLGYSPIIDHPTSFTQTGGVDRGNPACFHCGSIIMCAWMSSCEVRRQVSRYKWLSTTFGVRKTKLNIEVASLPEPCFQWQWIRQYCPTTSSHTKTMHSMILFVFSSVKLKQRSCECNVSNTLDCYCRYPMYSHFLNWNATSCWMWRDRHASSLMKSTL